jgi:regulator of sirC expression with transglutaminase-like and TPR domain
MDLAALRRRFVTLISQPQGDFRLAEAALLIAQEEYPALSVETYLQRLDGMAEAIRTQLGLELDPHHIVDSINAYLFDEQGFHGNQEEYYDPRNSFLNDVMDRKTGLPILLSVLYIEIGRQVGLPIVGVGMPGHFIVAYTAQPEPFWIDPFYGGQILSRQDCAARVHQLYGTALPWQDAYLQPVSDHHILRRMLANLKTVYVQRQDYPRALSVVERLVLLSPSMPTEVRDRGLLQAQLGRLEGALDDLQHYLQLAPQAPDAAAVAQHLAALRQRLQS